MGTEAQLWTTYNASQPFERGDGCVMAGAARWSSWASTPRPTNSTTRRTVKVPTEQKV